MDGFGGLILMMVLLVVMMYFLTIRPQRKQMQEQEKALNQLEPGARVLLTNGMYATLREAGKQQMIVELAPGVEVAVLRQVVRRPVNPDEEEFEFVDDLGGYVIDELATDVNDEAALPSYVDGANDFADSSDVTTVDPLAQPDFLPADDQPSVEINDSDDRQVR